MAEIQSPISGGIQAVRRTVSSSAFTGAAAPPAPAQPDPQTVSLLSQNSFALSSVSGQLASISQQIGQLNFSLTNIQSNLGVQAQLERQRAAAEQAREAQLAEQGLREGKEGAVEQRIQSALLKPVQAISQKAQFTLGRLGQYFGVILAGWLGSKVIQFLRAKSEGNIDLMNQIRDNIVGGLLTIGGIFLGINLALKGLTRLLVSISGSIFRAVTSGMIVRPMKALMGLFGKAANLAYSIITKALGGSLVKTVARNTGPLAWVGRQIANIMPGMGKKPKMSTTGGGKVLPNVPGGIVGGGTISTFMDVASGENPLTATIVNALASGGAFFVGAGMGKTANWKRILAQILTFETIRGTGYEVATPKGNQGDDQGDIQGQGTGTDMSFDEIIQSEGGYENIMPGMMTPITNEDLIRERELANESKKPQGFMRGLAGLADFATFGATDFDKRGDLFEGKKKDMNVAQNISSLQEVPPSLINVGDSGSTGSSPGNSGKSGGKGNTLPIIPASDSENPSFLAAKFYGVALA